MHLLEALAFVPKIENSVVIRIRSSVGVLFHQRIQAFGGFIADFDHDLPRPRDLAQVFISPGGQRDEFVDGQQFGLKLPRFGVKWSAKIAGNGGYPTLETC